MKVSSIQNVNFRANKISKTQAQYFKTRFANAKYADIICHKSPDRDAINSAIVVQRYLNEKGVQSRIIIDQEPGKTGIKQPNFNYVKADSIKDSDTPPDTVICVDFSAEERIKPNVLNYMRKSPNLLCIDHHQDKDTNIFSQDYIMLQHSIENADKIIKSAVPCYVDSSAVSATSILYRLFETLDEEITSEQAYSIMFGMADDGAKGGFIKCDGKEGTIEATEKLKKDKNAYEIFKNLKTKLDDNQILRIAKAIDVMSDLSDEEQRFYDNLYKKLQFSSNNKIAYVEIPPDDKEWESLDGDNYRTSTILNRFRQDVLNNKFEDKRLEDVELAIAFYEADGIYKISAHAKHDSVLDFYQYIERLGVLSKIEQLHAFIERREPNKEKSRGIPDFMSHAGGRPRRGGGEFQSIEPEACHNWVNAIIECADFYDDDRKEQKYSIRSFLKS